MADKLGEMKDLMDKTLKLLRIILKKHEENPLKTLDYGLRLKDNMFAIHEINTNNDNFDVDDVSDEFIESLENFIEVIEKHRQDEKSPYHNVMNRDEVVKILVDLEKRYKNLAE